MSEELARLLDLGTAWTRVKRDVENRVFIRHPYAVALIESDLEGWLADRRDAVRTDQYSPSSMFVCDVPKGNGLIRPGSHLGFEDRLIYAACVGACYPMIYERLRWSQNMVDFSYRLDSPTRTEWLRDRFTGWKEFQRRSVGSIRAKVSHVVLADITAFYENIDLSLLLSDLRDSGAPAPAVTQLGVCLNRWAQIPGRGIPQGQSPSDILAKLYLNNIDHRFREMKYKHLRYVDDIRIFCKSRVEAKEALVDVSKLLRKRGLSLQSKKVEIYDAVAAKGKFEEVTARLRSVKEAFIEALQSDPYMSVNEADEFLNENPDDAPLEIIQQAYSEYVMNSRDDFPATLFRFLIRRLGKQRNSFAADHCLTLLEPHPEETESLLWYFHAIGPGEAIEARLAAFLRSRDCVYEYQRYQILEWFYEHATSPSTNLINTVRRFASDAGSERYLRTICRAFLGKFGTSADLERAASEYDETNDESERAEIICSIGRMEVGRRNSFLGRVADDGRHSERAARWVRRQPQN